MDQNYLTTRALLGRTSRSDSVRPPDTRGPRDASAPDPGVHQNWDAIGAVSYAQMLRRESGSCRTLSVEASLRRGFHGMRRCYADIGSCGRAANV
jgi:hypothetical protein